MYSDAHLQSAPGTTIFHYERAGARGGKYFRLGIIISRHINATVPPNATQ